MPQRFFPPTPLKELVPKLRVYVNHLCSSTRKSNSAASSFCLDMFLVMPSAALLCSSSATLAAAVAPMATEELLDQEELCSSLLKELVLILWFSLDKASRLFCRGLTYTKCSVFIQGGLDCLVFCLEMSSRLVDLFSCRIVLFIKLLLLLRVNTLENHLILFSLSWFFCSC